MGFEQFLFYLFAAVLVFAAARVVTSGNSVHAALYLVLAFFNSAALWVLLEAEFLAITLVLVYVGAVMVLFLFVVMMLDIRPSGARGMSGYLVSGGIVAAVTLAEMALLLSYRFDQVDPATAVRHGADYSNTKALGELLYTEYLYAFEIAAVLLLLAIVAAIALTLRRRPDTRYQRPGEQVTVKREDRVRLVRMPAEKPGS